MRDNLQWKITLKQILKKWVAAIQIMLVLKKHFFYEEMKCSPTF